MGHSTQDSAWHGLCAQPTGDAVGCEIKSYYLQALGGQLSPGSTTKGPAGRAQCRGEAAQHSEDGRGPGGVPAGRHSPLDRAFWGPLHPLRPAPGFRVVASPDPSGCGGKERALPGAGSPEQHLEMALTCAPSPAPQRTVGRHLAQPQGSQVLNRIPSTSVPSSPAYRSGAECTLDTHLPKRANTG